MKCGVNKKAVGLLLIIAFTLFPFRIFCDDDLKIKNGTLSIYEYDTHTDCPFCGINFYHDFDNPEYFKLDIISFEVKREIKTVALKPVPGCLSGKNKSPPPVFS